MPRILVLVICSIVFVATLIGGGLLLMGTSPDGMCGDSDIRSTPSPDGKLGLFVFTYDCGATTGYSTLVAIAAANTRQPDAGTAFYRENDATDVPVEWQSDTALTLTVPVIPNGQSTIIVDGVTVTYRTY